MEDLVCLRMTDTWTLDANKQRVAPCVVNLPHAFPEAAACLQKIETLPVSPQLTNLALVDPANFHLNTSRHVCRAGNSVATRFFLVGSVASSSLFSGQTARSISVAFSDRTFPRAMAVMAELLEVTGFPVFSYRGGISVSSLKKTSEFDHLQMAAAANDANFTQQLRDHSLHLRRKLTLGHLPP